MDAILEFKTHVIIRDVDLKPSKRDVENAIKEMLYEYFSAEMIEISELAVRYEGEEDE